MRELRLSSWTLSRGSRLLLCHKENVILTQGSPLKWVCPAVFTDHHHEGVIMLWWWEAMPVGALKLLMQKRKGKGRKLKASTEQIPRPGKLQLCWTAFSLPSHGPPQHTMHTHFFSSTGGWPFSASEAFSAFPTRQAQAVGRGGHLGSGDREEPSWPCWAHLKVLQTFGQCVFLRGLITKDGLFPLGGWRDSTLSGHWILSLSPGSLSSLTHTVNPPYPQGKQQGLRLSTQE